MLPPSAMALFIALFSRRIVYSYKHSKFILSVKKVFSAQRSEFAQVARAFPERPAGKIGYVWNAHIHDSCLQARLRARKCAVKGVALHVHARTHMRKACARAHVQRI